MAKMTIADPAVYDAWYRTPRGRWIGGTEFSLLMSLLSPMTGAALLDVGCGTGWFSRRFAAAGLRVTGIDRDDAAIAFAGAHSGADIFYISGSALSLPLPDRSFDYCAAITSLCFIPEPAAAIREMWRVTRKTLVLGLLHRHSMLYRQKQGQGSYAGARWDTVRDVRDWIEGLPAVACTKVRYGIFLSGGNRLARLAENILPHWLPVGGFLAVALYREQMGTG